MGDGKTVKVEPVKSGARTDQELMAHLAAQVGDGRLFKMDVDYASQVDEAIPKANAIAAKGDVAGALDSLANLEKLSRLGSDMKSNTRIVKLCFDGKKWDLLNDTILTLSKKRLIIKMAIAKMVRDACEMVEKMPNEELKMKLVDTLRTVTAGKIYVEVERARLTSLVVKKLEAEGKLEEATNLILELQVETYGSMEIKEKVEFLLEQMRLTVARADYIRASIISNKISTKFFNSDKEDVQDLKLRFYNLMITIGLQDSKYLEVCRHYRAIFDTPKIAKDHDKSKMVLKCAVIYCLLAPHTNEQWDLLNRIAIMRELELVPDYKALVELFINQELISWKNVIVRHYEKILKKARGTGIFDGKDGEKRWKDLHMRVGEHNMRMISKYYTQITFDRLAELLDFPLNDMESFLCNLIVTGAITDAKIHRPSRVVNLRARKANLEQLDQWASNVHKLTETLNKILAALSACVILAENASRGDAKGYSPSAGYKVSHLILKEQMVHRNLEAMQVN
ncbi:PCI domain protein [Ancylostoma duodenale]|uniref:PCI domain protein n=2 Tax=Ancylostoma duodenale TaxID=51022 RepID=A0A0C2CYQ5_9BILA|nr:PCI domain protein [Ancylostoma duodenale]